MITSLNLDEANLNNQGRYIIITAMRNEINTVEFTVNSVLKQSQLPKLWVILDDGSTDGSSEVIEGYALKFPWIVRVSVPDRGFDLVGKGVADLINYGLSLINSIEVEFVAKLDADLDFDADYFESLLSEMDADQNLAIVSGHPYVLKDGRKMLERHSDYFPSGTARLYRYKYLQEIGSFVSSVGWDTVDLLRMMMRGYKTKIVHSVLIHHMRRMGTRLGYLDGMIRDGRNNYITGYPVVFFVLRSIYNAKYYPYIVRTLCMLYGYLMASIKKIPRAVTEEEHKFHADLQTKRIKNIL